jgi:hypothetical protein
VSALVRDTPAFGGSERVGINLRQKDLRGQDLRGQDFDRAQMAGVHLEGSDLTDARMICADLTGAHLDGAKLVRAKLRRATLIDSEWTTATDWPPAVGELVRNGSDEVKPGVYRVTQRFKIPAT